MKILIIGQCTLHWGRMEFGNPSTISMAREVSEGFGLFTDREPVGVGSLERAGSKNIKRYNRVVSKYKVLQNLETREESNLIVEVVK